MFGRFVSTLILAFVVFLGQIGQPIGAEENRLGLIPMNTRIFDVGVDPASLRRDPDFIPLNRIPWLQEHINHDPLLRRLVIHIDVLNHPVDHLWKFPGPAALFDHDVTLPDQLTLEGYSVKSSSPDHMTHLLFIPKDESQSFSVDCSVNRKIPTEFSFCGVAAAYRPDPQIFLKIRIYDPQLFEDFPKQLTEMVEKVRKIAYCLDVTGDVQENVDVAEKFKMGTDCKLKLTS